MPHGIIISALCGISIALKCRICALVHPLPGSHFPSRALDTALLALVLTLLALSGSILVISSIPLVDAPVLGVFRIGPVTAHTKVNTVTLINADMAWKTPDMMPTATIVMIIVATSIIEIDAN